MTSTALPLFARYVPRLVTSRSRAIETFEVSGSLVFADVSGFTNLSERLAEQGRAGAEELTEILNGTFTDLLTVAFAEGGDLLKYGGDALLLLFQGAQHAERACRSAAGMRRALRDRGAIATGRGKVVLRVSQGVHSGTFRCFVTGDEQQELIVTGGDATMVTHMETTASAGEILVSPSTAELLRPNCVGAAVGDGFLLKRTPTAAMVETAGVDDVTGDPERFVAPAIRARIVAGVHEAEHRHTTVGFVHVAELDHLIDDVGPDDVLDRLDRLVRTATARAADSSICLISTDIAPDGTKLIFTAGAPDAIEDGEGAMLSVLRAVLDATDDLELHAGVASGHVFAGEVGAPFRAVYTVIGDTVNLAARLMAKAQTGELVAHGPTVERSRIRFTSSPLEPFMVKGKSRPIDAASISERIGVRDEQDRFGVAFVGRRRELAVLAEGLDGARRTSGGCVFIEGEAGFGKSRLVDAFLGDCGEDSTRVICEAFQAESPYFVTRLLLRTMIGIGLDVGPREAGRRLEDFISTNVPDEVPYLPLLALAVDADVESTDTVDQISPENRPVVLADVIERVLRTTVTSAHVLVVENCEWMDDASAAVVARVLRRINTAPWLVVLTTRGDPTGLHAGLGFPSRTIELGPLDANDVMELAGAALGDTPVPDHEIDEICRRSAGNPLYLLELVQARSTVGSLDDIPTSLEDIVTARIDRLDPYDRRALRYAAVIGGRFPAHLAALAYQSELPDIEEPELWRRLRGFVFLERDGDVRFAHELLRHVAYEGLPYERRRELHERVGLALEGLDGEQTDDRVSSLSLHFDRARDRPRAWTYSREAARRAAEKYANLEAATFLERALEHGRADDVASPDEIAHTAERLGDVCTLIGRYDRSASAFALARSLETGGVAEKARLLRKEGGVRVKSGRYVAALRWYGKAMRTAQRLSPDERAAEEAELAVAYAGVRYRQGKVAECARWSRDAIQLAERGGNRRAEAHAYYLLDAALTDLGDEEAEAVRGRALPIFEELGDLHGQANVLQNLGVDAFFDGNWDQAADYYTRCREVRSRAGDIVGIADVGHNLGELRSDQGRLERAEALLRDARRTFRAAQYPLGVAVTTNGLGRLRVRAGAYQEGLELLREAQAAFRELGATAWVWESDAYLSEALAYAGEFEDAVAAVDQAFTDHGFGDSPTLVACARRSRGIARGGLGDVDAALADLTESIQSAETGKSDFDVALALFERSRLDPDSRAASDDAALANEIFERLGVDAQFVVSPVRCRST